MRKIVLLSCGLVLQLLACGSDDNAAVASGTGGASSSGGSSNSASSTATENLGGSTESVGGSTASSSSGGSTASSSGSATTNSSNPNAGGTTASSTASSGGSTNSTSSASGGTPDTTLATNSPHAGKLMINELCPSNHAGAMEGGSYPDWVELYNSSSDDIRLKGFYITDDNAELTKFALTKDVLVVKAGGVLLLWSDGDADETDFHLGFSLSAAGETLTLLDSDQKVIDSVNWSNAKDDEVYARLPDGTGAFSWCTAGTPNRMNGSACP